MVIIYIIVLFIYGVCLLSSVLILTRSESLFTDLFIALYFLVVVASALIGLAGRKKRKVIEPYLPHRVSDSRKYLVFALAPVPLIIPSEIDPISLNEFAVYGIYVLVCVLLFIYSSKRDPLSRFYRMSIEDILQNAQAPGLPEFCSNCGSKLAGRYCIYCGHDSRKEANSINNLNIHTERDLTTGNNSNRVVDLLQAQMNRTDLPKVKPAKHNYVSLDDFLIPEAIHELLWFKNGNDHNLPCGADEPSAIDAKLPIVRDNDAWKLADLDYYPAYAKLTPGQRAIYLDWLRDIRQHVAIGYVFIFYYGLERYLFTDKYNDAVDAILALRKYHYNNSFRSYSSSALALCAVTHKDLDLFEEVQSELSDAEYIWARNEINGFLNPVDLIRTHRSWGFANTRYLHGDNGVKDLYFNTLVEVITEHYGQDTIPVDGITCKETTLLVLANYGMPQNVREHRVPDITKSPEFAAQMQGLLTETHERVKVQLRELRKIQNE